MMKTEGNILRPRYLDKILRYEGKGIIKVLTGQRRVGKSWLLRSTEENLRQRSASSNFITINLEDFAFSHIRSAKDLNDEICGKLSDSEKNYIFVDEIQEIEGFDRVIRSLSLDPRNDIYVTGSNSSMLSSEIASRLAGRSIEIRVHPLSYEEFLEFHGLGDSEESIDLYVRYGGMPYLRNLPIIETWTEHLTGLTDALVYRDIVSRHSIRNNDFLQRMLLFLADNTGRIFTAKSIADYIKAQRISGTVNTVQTYVDYICEAYITNKARRWDIEGKKFFEIGEKYYFEDLGIRNSIIGYRPMDVGLMLENAVYNKLAGDGYDVRVGVISKNKEIDFVAEKDGERKYVQAAVNVYDKATAEREFGNLETIGDNYEKILVTLRDSSPNTQNGIRMLSLRDFLMEGW
ncbi:MAG: ATP-binding protein [Lachnospiraceae bacterium]|nr:ATP-binding protein [Lachnospiraceae bacterium]